MHGHRVTLEGRNQGVRYEDGSGVYRFEVAREGKVWRVHLPPTNGERFEVFTLSSEQREVILPRIQNFLSRIWWLGIWPVNYTVSFVE